MIQPDIVMNSIDKMLTYTIQTMVITLYTGVVRKVRGQSDVRQNYCVDFLR